MKKYPKLKKRLHLVYNYQLLEYNKTLEENGIFNGSILGITDKIYNIKFRTTKNNTKNMSLDGNCTLKKAIKLYCELFKGKNIYQYATNNKIFFIYNSIKLNIEDKKSLKDLFIDNISPVIIVNDTNNLPGG